MQALRDIFTKVWPNASVMAIDIGEEYDTVRRWRSRGRIPERAWPKIIEKAARREILLTAGNLMAMNREPKRRGVKTKDVTKKNPVIPTSDSPVAA
jgi:hypothetical protein